MTKSKRRNRIDFCDFSNFTSKFKAEVVWIDAIYKMFKSPLVPALLRDALREHGVYYQCQFWRLVPPHFVYFSLISSKNSLKAGKDLSHFMRLFGYPLFLETLIREDRVKRSKSLPAFKLFLSKNSLKAGKDFEPFTCSSRMRVAINRA